MYNNFNYIYEDNAYGKKEILYIVVPCYNEETVLPETMKRLKEKITNLISTIICISTLIINIIKDTLNNWSFLIYSIWITTSLQMISLGIIGEYVGKIYMETKKRPVYIIEENLDNRKER